MSGHSKWSTIKRKKGAADAARGKLFTRMIREISIAARSGGGDPESNPRLRTAIQNAKSNNMPNDNIDRAIKKGTGEGDGGNVEEIVYEGYGPFGVAVLIEAVTDNRNRTASEIRHVFTKYGGNLGTNGSVAYLFDQRGVIQVEASNTTEEALLEAALEAGAEDVDTSDSEVFSVLTQVKDFHAVLGELEKSGIKLGEAKLDWIPQTTKELGAEEAGTFFKFWEMLEDTDDVQNAYANFEVSDAIMEKLGN